MRKTIFVFMYLILFTSFLFSQNLNYGIDIKVNTTEANWAGALPVVTELKNGNLVVSWFRDYKDIVCRIYDSKLNPITDELLLWDTWYGKSKSRADLLIRNTKDVNQEEFAICSLANGGFALITRIGGMGWDTLRIKYFYSSGVSRGINIDIIGSYLKEINHPSAISLENGNLFICWHVGESTGSTDYWKSDGVFGRIYDLDGDPVTETIKVNTSNNIYEWSPCVASLSNGNFIVTWGSGTEYWKSHIYAQLFDIYGNKVGTQFLVNPDTLGWQFEPHVTQIENDKFAVFWSEDTSNIIGRIFNNDLQVVNVFSNNASEDFHEPYAIGLKNGNIFLSYHFRYDDMNYGLLFDNTGNVIGRDFFMGFGNYHTNYMRTTTFGTNGFVACWQGSNYDDNDTNIFIRYFLNNPLVQSLTNFSLTEPLNDQIISSYHYQIDFKWNKASVCNYPFEVVYNLLVDNDVDFSSPICNTNITDTTFTVWNLEDNCVYNWKVIAKNLTGDSMTCQENFAFVIPIYIPDTSNIHDLSNDEIKSFKLNQNYPNPFNTATVIRYKIPAPGEVEINVYNIEGKLIHKLIKQEVMPGDYTVKWDATGNASGIYFYMLIHNDEIIDTKRMVFLK